MSNEVKNTSCIEALYNKLRDHWEDMTFNGIDMKKLSDFKQLQQDLLSITEYVYNNPIIEDEENKIELTSERTVDMVEFDFEVGSRVYKMLRDYALNNILRDDEELINWAVNDILKRRIEELEEIEENGQSDISNHPSVSDFPPSFGDIRGPKSFSIDPEFFYGANWSADPL